MHNRTIAIIGLGYVGLPVAVAFGKKSKCIGFDINKERIEDLKNFMDKTNEVSIEDLKNTNIKYTHNIEELKQADFYIIAVPTPVDNANNPNLSPVLGATNTIAKVLKKNDIVVYESTVYPGLTEEECVPILEKATGLKCNKDFFVGYSPERINPGDRTRSFTKIKKIVSAVNAETLEIVANVYGSVVEAGIFKAKSIKVAEAAKVIENTQRDLNIALMNELAIIFHKMGIDTQAVLDAASSKWNFLPFSPGLVGGHCIGVDPYYLTYKSEILGYIPQVILAGRRINDNMGKYVAQMGVKLLIKNGVNVSNAKANVLGITFKENCPDLRNSKVIDLINELKEYQVNTSIHDPLASAKDSIQEYNVKLEEWEKLNKADILVVAVAHKFYKDLQLNELTAKVKDNGVIIDVKSILPAEELMKMGYILWRL